jgi:hydroxylamine reductase (hybrid-cluster protein)
MEKPDNIPDDQSGSALDDQSGSALDELSRSSKDMTNTDEESGGTRVSADDKELRDRIIKDEEKGVRNARLLVIVAIVACAAAVSSAVYIFAAGHDQTTFELEVSKHFHKLSSLQSDSLSNTLPIYPSTKAL